ncbi:hypothetical protein ALCH109712_11415 [Alkalicoccus chagannorensis]
MERPKLSQRRPLELLLNGNKAAIVPEGDGVNAAVHLGEEIWTFRETGRTEAGEKIYDVSHAGGSEVLYGPRPEDTRHLLRMESEELMIESAMGQSGMVQYQGRVAGETKTTGFLFRTFWEMTIDTDEIPAPVLAGMMYIFWHTF